MQIKKFKNKAIKMVQKLERSGLKKAAFYGESSFKDLPDTTEKNLSLPSDSWNQGNNSRIEIPKGAKIRFISLAEAIEITGGGKDRDLVMGLWVSEFTYKTH